MEYVEPQGPRLPVNDAANGAAGCGIGCLVVTAAIVTPVVVLALLVRLFCWLAFP